MELITQFAMVASFIGGIVGWAVKQGVTNPLTAAIKALQITINEFKQLVDKMQENQHNIDKRLGIVEEQIKVANHRIEDLEETNKK